MPTLDQDELLILRLRAGDLEALGELYDRYNSIVYRTALAITCNQAAAEKVLQECFLELNGSIHTFDRSNSVNHWLIREATHKAADWAKQRQRWPLTMDWQRQLADGFFNDSKNVIQSPGALINALANLEIQQRVVVVLHYYNALNIDEMSTILACSPGTVKSHLHYGRENLRRQLNTSLAGVPETSAGLNIEIQELFFPNREI